MTKPITCGVLVQCEEKILCCHVTQQTHWDLPKGLQNEGETTAQTASRELLEETGLTIHSDDLIHVCTGPYNNEKNMALYGYKTENFHNFLRCTSTFSFKLNYKTGGGEQINETIQLPEVDDFRWVTIREFNTLAAKSMQKFLHLHEYSIRRFLYNY